MTYQPSEIADLILLIALGPVIVVALRRISLDVPWAGFVAFGAMLWSYVFTIAEGFVLPDLFNLFEHLGYAVAGLAFAIMLAQFASAMRAMGERPR